MHQYFEVKGVHAYAGATEKKHWCNIPPSKYLVLIKLYSWPSSFLCCSGR